MQTFENIKALLDKYFDGESSLEEEVILKKYFTGEQVDARLKSYTPLFQFFTHEKELTMTKTVDLKTVSNLKILRGGNNMWRMAAAVAVLIVGCFFIYKQFETPAKKQVAHKAKMIILDENSDPEMALAEVNKALMLVSKKMKKGQEETEESLMKVQKATHKMNEIMNMD
jgi:hypothetical protein